MPHYTIHGKITTPLSHDEFLEKMSKVSFPKKRSLEYKAFLTLLYYTGARKTEVCKLTPSNLTIKDGILLIDFGQRLKHGLKTPSLPIQLDLPYVHCIIEYLKKRRTRKLQPLFKISSMTAWRLVHKTFGNYPHWLRLSRITNFFQEGFTIAQVKSWTGHRTLSGLEPYVGMVDVKKMGESLK